MAETPSFFDTNTPTGDIMARLNDNFKAIDDENRTKIIREGDTPRVLIGYQKDGFGTGVDYGIKVSENGYDVTSAEDINLAFSSAFKNFKLVAEGTYTVPKAGGITTVTAQVAHGLGYTPYVMMFATYDGGTTYQQTPLISVNTTSGIIDFLAFVYVDSTNVTFNVRAPSAGSLAASSVTTEFSYYLFVETADL